LIAVPPDTMTSRRHKSVFRGWRPTTAPPTS
jgi:hypothetical protein